MNAKEYLGRLDAHLKGLADEERAALIDEIALHIETGESDPRLGCDPETRSRRISDEMGSPEDLGRQLKQVHNPRRWLDFLLVVVPGLLISPGVKLIFTILFPPETASPWWGDPQLYFSIRVIAVLEAVMVLIAWRRGSPALMSYWTPQVVLTIFTLLYREKRWSLQQSPNISLGGGVESLFWLVVMIGLALWLIKVLLRERDPLLLGLAALPILFTVGNMSRNALIAAGRFPDGYNLPRWTVLYYFGSSQVSRILWPAFYFLTSKRAWRWFGLLVFAVPLAIMNLIASVSFPTLAVVWLLPIFWVAVLWTNEIGRQVRSPSGSQR